MASAVNFFTEDEKEAIVASIRKAELHTSGEIRVHADDRCDGSAYDRAIKMFEHLNMNNKPFRNAVLIYVAVKDRKFAVIGDEALHSKVGTDYWKKITARLHDDFSEGHYGIGIQHAIETIGATLTKYFPDVDELDRNELPDEISFE
ncbi:MAG: TPM domain-containing protein [Chitinophagales bacterium]